MATLVLGALGTFIGGPAGGAIGALIGRQVDGAIIGSPGREGPRLTDLAVTTSSYGQPIARHYGRVRAPGTIIWSSDLKESSESSGGGKGQSGTTQYSYSISFAVALSSRPIDRVGRIWADGNLLRGAAGDLKTGGTLRVHTGHEDQGVDPLLAATIGSQCPAHRGCAYAVFEDLALADFGNRIPALSFEIFAGSGSSLVAALLDDEPAQTKNTDFAGLEGFSHDGGSLASVLAQVNRLEPLAATSDDSGIAVSGNGPLPGLIPTLPEASSWSEGDFGREGGWARSRRIPPRILSALRYYDPARDYQPGLQRAGGVECEDANETLEFPGVLSARNSQALVRRTAARERAQRETLAWRCTELDPSLAPGSIVRAPGLTGLWQVIGWEWREVGIELQLARFLDLDADTMDGASGSGWLPPDRLPQPTLLRIFEVPWDGFGSSSEVRVLAAASAAAGPWSGAALYSQQNGALVPTGETAKLRAVSGALVDPLAPGQSLRFDSRAELTLQLHDESAGLDTVTVEAIARGANRMLVGAEILQFAEAQPLGAGIWMLRGLLRGRGASEPAALAGHDTGTEATLLDRRLVAIPEAAQTQSSRGGYAALGFGDADPVLAKVENAGTSRQPPFPVKGRIAPTSDGSLCLNWTRRSRGGWIWLDGVEQPLVEQEEKYQVGLGPVAAPIATWTTTMPSLTLSPEILADLASHTGEDLWVRQVGSFALSAPLLLGALPPNS